MTSSADIRYLCRHAAQLLAFHSLTSLASVLDMMRPPKSTMRFAIVLAELLTRSAGAMGCEAVLGWWTPGEVPSEVVSASVVAAAGLSPRLSLAWQELVLHQQRNAAAEASAAAAAGTDEREPGSPSGMGPAAANDEDGVRRHKHSRRNRDERSSRRHSSRHSDDPAADLESDQPAAVRPEAGHDAGHLRQTDEQAQQPCAGSADVAVLVKPDPDLPDSEAPMNGTSHPHVKALLEPLHRLVKGLHCHVKVLLQHLHACSVAPCWAPLAPVSSLAAEMCSEGISYI